MKTTIIIATHKQESILENEIFRPIQVGSAINDYIIKPNYYRDNTGENISEKNRTFNELTAIYWVWKNLQNEEIYGLMHYRRFLNIFYKKPFYKNEKRDIMKKISSDSTKIAKLNDAQKTNDKIKELLNQYDVIVANPVYCRIDKKYVSITEDYKKHHLSEDWDTCMNIVKEYYPEFKKSIEKHLDNDKKLYYGNIFIAKKEWFNDFCEWIFTILFEVEKRITISEDPYQRRVIGFLSERLFTLYILHYQFKTKGFPIFYVED